MGFVDNFVGLLNKAMSKESPAEEDNFDASYDFDFGDDADVDVSGEDTELTYTSIRPRRRTTYKSHNDENLNEDSFDDSDSVKSRRIGELYDDTSSVFEEDATTFVSSSESSYARSERTGRASRFESAPEVTNERKGDRRVVSMNNNSNLKVFLAKPTEYKECKDICSRLRSQMTVVVNLEKVKTDADKIRIIDFISGCSYALDCNFERISSSIYIVAPCNVDIFEEIAESNNDNMRKGAECFTNYFGRES